ARSQRKRVVSRPQQRFVAPNLNRPSASCAYSNLSAIIYIDIVSQRLIEQGRVNPRSNPINCSSCPLICVKEVMVTSWASCLLHGKAGSNQRIIVVSKGKVIDGFTIGSESISQIRLTTFGSRGVP